MSGIDHEELRDLKLRVNNLEARLPQIRDDVMTLREKTDKIDAGIETLASVVKKIESPNGSSPDGTSLQRIAEAVEGILDFKRDFARDPEAWRKRSKEGSEESSIDIWGIKWLQRDRQEAPENPKWGWAFAYDRNGDYIPESRELVKYLEEYGEYHSNGYVVKLGGNDGKLLQLNRKE